MSAEPKSRSKALLWGGGILLVLFVAGIALYPRVQRAFTAYRLANEKNSLRAIGISYHNFHDAHGRGPTDAAEFRKYTRELFDDPGEERKGSIALDWIDAGRLDVAWRGDFRLAAMGGPFGPRVATRYYLAKETEPDESGTMWLVTWQGAVVRGTPGELTGFEPLPASEK